ncbi:hypothetical protein E1B28_003618 [Marasmius oreades]|uniref:Uncharacterized protein n=1 Tax=Marasmius oreades TaxID=181124 RepID=A0A9P7UNL5_9AGAR|nr:uncharacterized protein E1B28_003618 [Marasmius oreades]KAG7086104.1 hypothetical protein E1B28_003618 [Marasmius oreades]
MSEDSGKGNGALFSFLYHLYKSAKAVPEGERNNIQKELVTCHYSPAFMQEKWDVAKTNSVSNTKNNSVNTNGIDIASEGSDVTPKHVPQPQKQAPTEEYIQWVFKQISLGNCPTGIRQFEDNEVSTNFVELVLTPNLYRSFIEENPLPQPTPTIEPYKGDTRNLTPQILAAFLRMQAVPPTVVDDMALFAILWLQASGPSSDVHNDHEQTQLHSRLLPLLEIHGIPSRIDENRYLINKTTELLASAPLQILDISGTVIVPVDSNPTPITTSDTKQGIATAPSNLISNSGNNTDPDTIMTEVSTDTSN